MQKETTRVSWKQPTKESANIWLPFLMGAPTFFGGTFESFLVSPWFPFGLPLVSPQIKTHPYLHLLVRSRLPVTLEAGLVMASKKHKHFASAPRSGSRSESRSESRTGCFLVQRFVVQNVSTREVFGLSCLCVDKSQAIRILFWVRARGCLLPSNWCFEHQGSGVPFVLYKGFKSKSNRQSKSLRVA